MWSIRRRSCWLAVIASAACDKGAPPAPATALPAAPLAPPALIELSRFLPTSMVVSSTVANPAILPRGLADHDLATAWNSATGKLVGETIDINIENSLISEVRMTVGFTAKGPRGEDYFAMNQRISKVSLLRYHQVFATATLDPNRRGLQTIAVPPTINWFQLRIDEVVPGTMKTWREAAISELEVWGVPRAGATLSPTPLVPAVEVAFTGAPAVGADPFAGLCAASRAAAATHDAAHADYLASCAHEHSEEGRMACAAESPSRPQCDVGPAIGFDDVAPPWNQVALRCEHVDMSGTPWPCQLAFLVGKRVVLGPAIATVINDMGAYAAPTVEVAVVADLLPDPGPELFVRVKGEAAISFVCVGGADPKCSEPIDPTLIAGDPPTKLPPSAVSFSHDR